MWWTCEKVKRYWTHVGEIIKEIIQQKINFKPEIALLNIMSEITDKKIKYCLMYILVAARLLWAQKWKSEEIPTMEEILKKLLDIAELGTLLEALRKQPRDYVKQSWNLIHTYINLYWHLITVRKIDNVTREVKRGKVKTEVGRDGDYGFS